MNPTTCPHCGKSLMEYNDTIIDHKISEDSIPRLSSIDARWDPHDEPTRLQSVPLFTLPKSLRNREVSDSQKPTPVKTLRPRQPPRPWLVLTWAVIFGLGLGVVLVEHEDSIFRFLDQHQTSALFLRLRGKSTHVPKIHEEVLPDR